MNTTKPSDDLLHRLTLVAQAIKPIKGLQGMDETIRAAIVALAPADTVQPWPKFVQDEVLEILRNVDTQFRATGQGSARIERAINMLAAAPAIAPAGDARCNARVKQPQNPLPGPPNPPRWCCLTEGHEGPHKFNSGGMHAPTPFRDSWEVEFTPPAAPRGGEENPYPIGSDDWRTYQRHMKNRRNENYRGCGGTWMDACYQERVGAWMDACFPRALYGDMTQRCDRFLEESLELLQAQGYDRGRVATLVDYVWGRPVGDPKQEVGGTVVTLAALCWVAGIDMHDEAWRELERIERSEVMAKIRAKQEMKNALHFDSPLPGDA